MIVPEHSDNYWSAPRSNRRAVQVPENGIFSSEHNSLVTDKVIGRGKWFEFRNQANLADDNLMSRRHGVFQTKKLEE
jgi:hypothetical protein